MFEALFPLTHPSHNSQSYLLDHVTSEFEILHWLPITLRTKTKFLSMAEKAPPKAASVPLFMRQWLPLCPGLSLVTGVQSAHSVG